MVQEAKSPVKISSIYIYIYTTFLALLGAPYIYDISRLRVKELTARSLYKSFGVKGLMLGREVTAVYFENCLQKINTYTVLAKYTVARRVRKIVKSNY
jgi:hypothetical protein